MANIEKIIAEYCKIYGISAKYRGYEYIKEAVRLAVSGHQVRCNLNKTIFPLIAEKFEIKLSLVESNIRRTIEKAYEDGGMDFFKIRSGFTPTTALVIAHLSEDVKNEMAVTA